MRRFVGEPGNEPEAGPEHRRVHEPRALEGRLVPIGRERDEHADEAPGFGGHLSSVSGTAERPRRRENRRKEMKLKIGRVGDSNSRLPARAVGTKIR